MLFSTIFQNVSLFHLFRGCRGGNQNTRKKTTESLPNLSCTSTSTKILNSFNKLKMMSEVVLLPNTEFLQQVEDDVTQVSKQYTTPCQIWILLQS
jgi:hypothetical protein